MADVADQRFSRDYRDRRGEMKRRSPLLLEMPSCGWIEAHHVQGVNVGAVDEQDGDPPGVMVMTYADGIGDRAGIGLYGVLPVEHARMIEESILRMCARIEAGDTNFASEPRRPPAPDPERRGG